MDQNPTENENNLSDIILEEGEEYDPPEQGTLLIFSFPKIPLRNSRICPLSWLRTS